MVAHMRLSPGCQSRLPILRERGQSTPDEARGQAAVAARGLLDERWPFGHRVKLEHETRSLMKKIGLFAVLLSLLGFGFAHAHSGGTDASGCHYDHKTGIYHCH